MSFFEHIGGDRVPYQPPKRVYGWVDATSQETEDGYTRLDCLDAEWADGAKFGSLADPESAEEAEQRVSMLLWRAETEVEAEGAIAELTLGDPLPVQSDATALHFLNLTGPPIPREVKEVRWPGPKEAAEIARATDIGEEFAERDEIAVHLERVPPKVDAVAVYDVGQGSCTGLVRDNFPWLYFDMGGGALRDAQTFPTGFRNICTTKEPPVVLSHWHYDHWSLAKRFGGAILASAWIVPYQANLRPTAATLLGLLRRHGKALVCAPGMETLRVNAISLHDCTGKAMNDSGIAMVVWEGEEKAIVLPGDARYKCIADLPETAHSLVAAHHGGSTRATVKEIPRPDWDPAGRLVFSCGPGNSYRHPSEHSVLSHEEAGWDPYTHHLSTANRSSSHSPEHVHLYWNAGQLDIGVACEGQHCTLHPCHR